MQQMVKKLLLVGLLLNTFVFGGFASALKKQKFLQPDEAFKIEAVQKDEQIVTTITLADKIHIYKNDLKFRIVKPEKITLDPVLPPAVEEDGEAVYKKSVTVAIPLSDISSRISGDYTFEVELLGCSDKGICYQPFRKQFAFHTPKTQKEGAASQAAATQKSTRAAEKKTSGMFDKISALTHEGNTAKIADVLGAESAWFIVILFFIFGLLLALTPCIFPMIPILSSIIVSQSGSQKPGVAKAFFTSLVYVVAMALTYTVVGVVAGLVGADIQAAMQNPWVLTVFAAMFVALAFSLFGYYEIGLPASWQSRLSRVSDEAGQRGGFVGTAVMGVLSALIVGPCVAPPLGGAVLFISHTGDALLGGVALFVMSIGMGMPLLLVGIGAGKFMPKPGGWMSVVSQVFGVMMLGLAIFMLGRVLPNSITLMLWALLFMGSALYMGIFDGSDKKPRAKKLVQLFAVVLMLYGASLFVGALSGADSMLRPFERFTAPKGVAVAAADDKENHRGYSIARLLKEVAASDKPVVVDFGKESCTACKELEEITFPNPKVKEQLKKFTFIKIDVTDNTDEEKALLKKYELFGTPNIIFFDKNGKFMPEKSLTGFVKPQEFAEHLKAVKEDAK
ncbi:Cytochrome c-type biogenesis protein DsbD, protein-disulfide reductase [hydrothermal vent metagenome]|uniref:Cytochrome c-type biogenesis protein DsbD, protein-disulfide reductase n=1 Tax=hydrothermal vent metagenome TaxID=652676 RepID=A0A1W1E9J7_9ZZZZ